VPRFVLQQHDATTRHFDLRLEVGGVLRSWAVPKGPSLDPADKRLAMAVPDHDLGAGDFEGRHAGATRGSGAVIVWDRGTYRVADGGDPGAALAAGHLAVELHGHKLRGGWALTRVAGGPGGPGGAGPRERWVLVKVRDEHADRGRDVVADEPASVLSGRTLDELVAGARDAGPPAGRG
jgi:DNA ligase D-like protein (predicted 3'-phosphoesterase)